MRSATALHRVLSATVITALVGSAPVTAMAAGPKLQAKPAPARGGQRPVTHVGAAPAGTVRPTTEVVLSTGQGELINLPANVSDVWVSNPGVADVYVNNPHQIHLFGKDSGESTIFATSASGTVIYAANIRVSQNLSSIDRMVKLAMPDSDIKVTTVGQIAVLTGTVSSPEDSAAAQRLVTALLNPGVAIGPDAALKVGVINRLRAATPLQVNLQVRIAEVSRSFVKNIGVNLTSRGSGSTLFGITQGRQGTIATAPGTIGSGIINADGSLPGQTVFTQPAATGMGTTLGHSMGGHLLLRALVEGAARPDAAVLIAPMLGLHSPLGATLGERLARVLGGVGNAARPAWRGNERPATTETRQALLTKDTDRYEDEIFWQSSKPELLLGPPSWRWVIEAFASTRRLSVDPRLKTLDVPLLFVVADDDKLVDPKAALKIAAKVPDARVVRFGKESAHEILREADPVRNRAIGEIDIFLSSRAQR